MYNHPDTETVQIVQRYDRYACPFPSYIDSCQLNISLAS